MIFTEEQIEAYREIYRKKFNEEISKEYAIEEGIKLVNFVRVLLNHGSKLMCEDLSDEVKQKLLDEYNEKYGDSATLEDLKYKNLPDVF